MTKRMTAASQMAMILATAVMLAGCHREPKGQVVATVDGHEITRRDLLAELRAAGGSSEADLNTVQAGLVSTLVDRKLLVEEAKRERLDKSPEFLAAEQRQHDALLASMLVQSFNARATEPDKAAVNAFTAANPQMFGARKLLVCSQISVPAKGITKQAVAPLNNQQQVVAFLNARKIRFTQHTNTFDTLTLPKPIADQLLALPHGMPAAIVTGGAIVFTTVVESRDAPVPADQQFQLAKAGLQRQTMTQTVDEQLKQYRNAADIKYLPGFEPAGPEG